jgi:hypothetical protein
MHPRGCRARRPLARGDRHRRRHRRIAAATALAAATAVAAACGASEPTSSEAAAAEAADAVCTTLREWNNDLGDSLNATSGAITDDDDPDTANDVLLDGFDELVELAEEHRAEVDELDLAPVADRDALLAELAEGADAAVEVLEEERDEVADLPPITVERQAGALGGAFVAVEGALSVMEPQVGGYRPELREAFAAEDGCRHVIQPTRDAEARP